MTFYGHVRFIRPGVIGAIQQNEVMRIMVDCDIIVISDDKLAKWLEEDLEEKVGCLHTYELHNIKELIRFRRAMHKYVKTLAYREDIKWWVDRKKNE